MTKSSTILPTSIREYFDSRLAPISDDNPRLSDAAIIESLEVALELARQFKPAIDGKPRTRYLDKLKGRAAKLLDSVDDNQIENLLAIDIDNIRQPLIDLLETIEFLLKPQSGESIRTIRTNVAMSKLEMIWLKDTGQRPGSHEMSHFVTFVEILLDLVGIKREKVTALIDRARNFASSQ